VTTFRVATEADDATLRAMLRENGMPTWVEMTMEREPSFFAGKDLYGRDWAVIAEDKDDVIGMYTASGSSNASDVCLTSRTIPTTVNQGLSEGPTCRRLPSAS